MNIRPPFRRTRATHATRAAFSAFAASAASAAFIPLALLLAASGAARAESASSASISTSLTTSSASISNSIERSSDSSSRKDKVAQGDYRVVEIAEAAGRPGHLRVHLQALAAGEDADDDFFLVLPRQAAENGRLAAGAIVAAQPRPYGIEFAAADGQGRRQAFFLVLDETWQRELKSLPVVL
ncbi:MAG: hypothetical protein ABW005_00755 [Burkholderiaceae bacterium]